MSTPSDDIRSDRLLETADAVLQAVVEVSEDLNGSYVHPPRVMGSSIQPACLADFTLEEVERATQFLVRMGILPGRFMTVWT